jgi:hypothetical protein
MKSCFITAAATALLLLTPSLSLSQTGDSSPQEIATTDTSGGGSASDYGYSDGSAPPATLELGVLIGQPMAISGKYWLNRLVAIDAAVGWAFSHHGKLDVLGDILVHPYYIPISVGDFPTYIGAGATFRVGNGDSFLGVRFPIGAEFLLSGYPVSVFGEVVPVMEVLPDMGFRMEGGAGIRFAFGRK